MWRAVASALVILSMWPVASRAQTSTAAQECLKRDESAADLGEGADRDRNVRAWIEACRSAIMADPDNQRLSSALARAFGADGRRAEALAIRRELGKSGNADALLDIYETYRSTYRTVDGKPQLVKRDEAEASLRKAAELGHPTAMWTLALLLDRGSTVRRNPVEAALWAERAMKKPPKDLTAQDIEVRLGHFLVKTNTRSDRERGLQILERYVAGRGRGDARAYLARAIRRDNPVRARTLLESAMRDAPGQAIPPLAEMLINGEGGPRDEKRAVALLQGRQVADVPAAQAVLGRILIEGRLLPRDVQEGIRLLRIDSVWSQETRIELMKLLATYSDAKVERPADLLYDALEAIEVAEPGVLAALYELKMSSSVQFMDRGGACALIEKYAKQGRDAALARSSVCQ